MNSESIVKYNIETADWSFINSVPSKINQLHPYPAKFIEQIPGQLLDIFGIDKELFVMDPFMGSGTTLLEAKRRGLKTVGIDLNPISYLISSVKLNSIPITFLDSVEEVISEVEYKIEKERIALIKISNAEHWFSNEVHKTLSALIQVIQSKLFCEEELNGLLLALSSIVVKVSYQESDTRYAAKENGYYEKDVLNFFSQACEKIYKAVYEENIKKSIETDLFLESSINFDYKKYTNKVGAVITSPPYPNAYEYWLYHKFRMEFLGFDPKEVKKEEIGTRTRYFRKTPESIEVFHQQMEKILQMSLDVLVDGGYIAVVVGRSIIRGVEYDNGYDIELIGKRIGLKFVTTVEREILIGKKSFNPKNSKINTEKIVVFKKGK
ncbi:DNA methyltransferase [Streptococcus parasanguinis]|uniref:DNA methyltransferase n=1 Tax=Streptococcus parasanguinis TaxID=1318 RepID=UPI00232AA676|nr:DNA methyltransferase [Streptococcus parasanguinis]MDB8628343.1 DNA methyltransferase [Streptococcus parasanguinis]